MSRAHLYPVAWRMILICCVFVVSSFGFQPLPVKNTRNRPRIGIASSSSNSNNNSENDSNSNNNNSENDKSPLDCLKEAMHRIHVLQEEGDSHNLLRKQPIRLGPSSISGAGSGVFATKNIKSGTIVGFYPVHGIGLERFDTNALATASKEDQEYFDRQALEDEDDGDGADNYGDEDDGNHNYLHYLIGSRPLCGYSASGKEATLFIDVNPNRAVQEAWIGHFINDGAIVTSNTEEGLLNYYRLSTQRKNCVHIPFGPAPILAAVTTSKVKKGDELFTTYGASYWLEALLQQLAEDGEEEEPVDISERVQMQAKHTAQDLFDAVQNTRVTYASLEAELETQFLSTPYM